MAVMDTLLSPWKSIFPPLIPAIVSLSLLAPYPAQAAQEQARQILPLDDGWQFRKAGEQQWQTVTVPHSFNGEDSASPRYYRGEAWYRRTLDLPRTLAGKRHFLEFDGAMLVTEVRVNGRHAGRHEGGFARFRFDVTRWLKPGSNEIEVKVDNAVHRSVAPLGGDYTMAGGLYRPVRLVSTQPVHFDMMDYGGPGVYFHASDVSTKGAALHWTARVANDSARPVLTTVTASLRDALGRIAATARKDVTLPPHSVTAVGLSGHLASPRLWQGVRDPYLYTSEAEISTRADTRPAGGAAARTGTQAGAAAGAKAGATSGTTDGATAVIPTAGATAASAVPVVQDRATFQAGIRDVRLDPSRGLLLNGAPYAVHGVNAHQTFLPGKGPAVSDADIDRDYRILSELGVTGVRYAHYQHAQRAYDLADKLGMLVWTEMPLNAEVEGNTPFLENSVQQLRELIRQNYNHPSVVQWGLGNEIYKVDETSARVLSLQNTIAHREDPSRPTVYANCCAPIDGPQASHTDAVGSNVYFGWYDGEFTDLGPFLDNNRRRRPTTPLAVSEYGAGGSALQQQDPPQRPQPGGRWHPEQYQALYHEAAWRQLDARPWLWGKFIWVGFDFPSAGRNEGDTPGFNDKGLVNYDRSVKKDAYYWYQANWTDGATRPMVYIASRRHTQRTAADAEVKVYSNQSSASLAVNGVALGERPVDGRIATWKVRLAPGVNRIAVTAGAVTDTVEWTLAQDKATPVH